MNFIKFKFNNCQEISRQRNLHLITSYAKKLALNYIIFIHKYSNNHVFKNYRTVNKTNFIEIYKYHIIVYKD
jgi:hypothetical protein